MRDGGEIHVRYGDRRVVDGVGRLFHFVVGALSAQGFHLARVHCNVLEGVGRCKFGEAFGHFLDRLAVEACENEERRFGEEGERRGFLEPLSHGFVLDDDVAPRLDVAARGGAPAGFEDRLDDLLRDGARIELSYAAALFQNALKIHRETPFYRKR